MPHFDDKVLDRIEASLRTFHENKSAIIFAGGRQGSNGPLDHWEIPKLELLQHIVPSICTSGAVMQWSADVTEHAHVTEIKQPARSGNNQDYYAQITRHLDHSNKCFRFDLATRIASTEREAEEDEDQEDNHEPDSEVLHATYYHSPTHTSVNFFEVTEGIASHSIPNSVCPPRIFASLTTAFRLAVKLSLCISVVEASETFGLPNLRRAITDYLQCLDRLTEANLASERMQIWFKVRVQQPSYHDQQLFELPQSLLASPPSAQHPGGRFDFTIISPTEQSDWPSNGLRGMFLKTMLAFVNHFAGHTIVQVRLIFHLLQSDTFFAYVQRFHVTTPPPSNTTDSATGMHILKRVVTNDGTRVSKIIPLHYICSPAHVIPRFGKEANPHLASHTCYDLSSEFWLNKYWNKEFYYVLSLN